MSLTQVAADEIALWQVVWHAKGKWHLHDVGDDFFEAQRLLVKLAAAGRAGVGIRCANIGFAPPSKYIDPQQRKLAAVNRKGLWWCPFCVRFRRFEKVDGWYDKELGGYNPGVAMCCPVCDISHRNGHVLRWNPIARSMLARKGTRARVSDKTTKRRRKRV